MNSVLVAVTHPGLASEVERCLANTSDLSIVGQATDVAAMPDVIRTLRPNLLIFDDRLPSPCL